MEKRTILAIVLSTLFLLSWYYFFPPAAPQKEIPSKVKTEIPSPLTAFPATPPEKILPSAEAKDISVNTETMRIIFSTLGGQPKHWYIKEKNTQIDLIMLPPSNSKEVWEVAQPSGAVVFRLKKTGFTEEKIYSFRSRGNWVDLTYKITNTGSQPVNLPLATEWGPGLGTDPENEKENPQLIRILTYSDQKLNKLNPGEYKNGFSWVGIDNRYFLIALLPQFSSDKMSLKVAKEEKLPYFVLNWESSELPPKTAKEFRYRIYLGPKKYYALKEYKLGLENSVDFGTFGFLGKIIFYTLDAVYRITKNYGWSIIILTIFLQVILSPLTIKSLKATQAMKKIQPQMKLLQTKYKQDPKRMQQELVQLYRREGVNPFGGCLPLILQIPIFWALFTALRNAYELRSAPFVFWIKDLSTYDPYYVLPILMGIVMFVQQKLTAVATDPTQARLMYIMPVIFTFMFLHFPSGLVLYWFTNSLLTFLEQIFLMKRWEKYSR